MKQQLIPLESASAWKDAYTGIKHTFGQTQEYCHAMQLTSGYQTFLYSYESARSRIVCPFAERRYQGHKDIVKPFGFSGFMGNDDDAKFLSSWRKFAGQRGYVCGYLGLNPVFDNSALFEAGEIYEYGKAWLLDLTGDIDDIFAGFHRGRRQKVRKWLDACNHHLIVDRSALDAFFLENYWSFMRRMHAASHYFLTRKTLEFLLSLDNVLLVGAGREGRVEAVTLFAYTADACDCLFHISTPEGQWHSAGLIWYGVEQLKSLGIPLLNLGGGGGGCEEFKRRFGARPAPLRCLKQIYQPELYQWLCQSRRQESANGSNFFPPYHQDPPMSA